MQSLHGRMALQAAVTPVAPRVTGGTVGSVPRGASSGAFALCSANEQIREVLEMSGFVTIMSCYGSVEEGLQVMSGSNPDQFSS